MSSSDVHSGLPPSKNAKKGYFPSRSMRKALAGLGLGAKLRFRRKSFISTYPPRTSTAAAQGLDALPRNQSTDFISPHNLQPLWESSTSVAARIPIKDSKSEISMGLAFRYRGMLLHRPAGFGKTTFLKELGQFCDVVRDSRSDSDKNLKYFSPENTKTSYAAIHRANYLILHFDFGNLLNPGASDTFTEAGFRDRLMSEIRGALEKYISKYSEKGMLGLFPIDDPSQLSMTQMCHYIPRRSDYKTIITVDNYDAPLLNAPPGKLTVVEDIIEDMFYRNVLVVFGGYGLRRPNLIVMGSGIRDHHAPAKRIVDCLGLIDCTMFRCYADVVGLTVAEIKGAIQELVEDEAMRFALFKEIEDTCWRESFVEGSNDVTTIVCSREVTKFLAGDLTKFGISQT
ncbi:hypothetical protein BT96DRAFT_1020744 [Gymnopus androsaceus JB14]|uniref:AAA-ATPase-like domain-containing protein n=1 Tax=Gymnopus androsaceus JB14 TaxID=1447944 RepID=A0A6A4HJ95_9AGAR|nr:hypothetical protein BT96DRAFT_1020744 [Gymnopus androsaceus JB14]